MITYMLAALRRFRTFCVVSLNSRHLRCGKDLHIGRGARLWAPDEIVVGDGVYIGKDVHIECNATIGNYALIANRVAFVGRLDHDFRLVGTPVRYSPWTGRDSGVDVKNRQSVTVGDDVWIGFGATVLTGVTLGRGCIVAAGSVVVRDVQKYSIVAGNPARVVGVRFSGEDAERHEAMIEAGYFSFSERGYDHWVVRPGCESY